MEIFNIKKDEFNYISNHYYFINDIAVLEFYQAKSCDLIMQINTYLNILSKVSFIIKKEEYNKLYYLIESMLLEIEQRKDYIECYKLFENGYFSWQSDAPSNEEEKNSNLFIYNYFNIIQLKNAYNFEFINNIKKCNFSVEINTDRSRYNGIRFDVYKLFKNMENVCTLKTLDYYLEKRKKLIKSN